jgi:hypothetical protein
MAVRGITVREVARRTGLSEAQVSRIRWNRLVNGPDPAQLAAIGRRLRGPETGRVMAKTIAPRALCLCGCGDAPRGKTSRYLPGHDARHYGQLARLARAAAGQPEKAPRAEPAPKVPKPEPVAKAKPDALRRHVAAARAPRPKAEPVARVAAAVPVPEVTAS